MTTSETEQTPLHTYESIDVINPDGSHRYGIYRMKVPGGWIYDLGRPVFVPEPLNFELVPGLLEEFTPGPVDV